MFGTDTCTAFGVWKVFVIDKEMCFAYFLIFDFLNLIVFSEVSISRSSSLCCLLYPCF